MKRSRVFGLTLILASASLAAVRPSGGPVLPFLEDDYGKALSIARAQRLPIFAEAWAPW